MYKYDLFNVCCVLFQADSSHSMTTILGVDIFSFEPKYDQEASEDNDTVAALRSSLNETFESQTQSVGAPDSAVEACERWNSCKNGTCVADVAAGYACECFEGFVGTYCEKPFNCSGTVGGCDEQAQLVAYDGNAENTVSTVFVVLAASSVAAMLGTAFVAYRAQPKNLPLQTIQVM